jgi:hypothetical protein
VLLCPKLVLKQLAHPQDGRAGWPENPVAIPLYVFLSEIKEQLIKIRRGPKRGKYGHDLEQPTNAEQTTKRMDI